MIASYSASFRLPLRPIISHTRGWGAYGQLERRGTYVSGLTHVQLSPPVSRLLRLVCDDLTGRDLGWARKQRARWLHEIIGHSPDPKEAASPDARRPPRASARTAASPPDTSEGPFWPFLSTFFFPFALFSRIPPDFGVPLGVSLGDSLGSG